MNTQHRMNVVVMVVELALLAIAGVLILTIFASAGMLQPFFAFSRGWFSLTQVTAWTRVLGVVLFAFVGTGIFNLCSYPQLFEKEGKTANSARLRHVVVLGTLIPMVLYLGWTLVGAATLSPTDLAMADAANEPTHIAIARKVGEFTTGGAWAITLTGYLFALMAVTSACNGFTESLADQVGIGLYGTQKSGIDWRPIILVLTAIVALTKDIFSATIDISAILSIAGMAGGGLLILILPFFFPYPFDRRSRSRYWEIAVVVITVLVLVAGILLEPTEGSGWASQVLTWIKWLIASSVASTTIWLLSSEPEESTLASGHITPTKAHIGDLAS